MEEALQGLYRFAVINDDFFVFESSLEEQRD